MRLIAAMVAAILTCVPANASSLDAVESKLFTLRDLKLDSGATLPEVTIAYETYGALAADGRNAVLITHSLTSSHHAAGKIDVKGVDECASADQPEQSSVKAANWKAVKSSASVHCLRHGHGYSVRQTGVQEHTR